MLRKRLKPGFSLVLENKGSKVDLHKLMEKAARKKNCLEFKVNSFTRTNWSVDLKICFLIT